MERAILSDMASLSHDAVQRLEAENARLRAVVDALPRCYGTWVSGSGADTVFAHDCRRPAMWTDERDDISIPWRFCDEHRPADWPATVEEYAYAEAVRALLAAERAERTPFDRQD